MTAPILLRTERLTLRPFQDSDVEDALSYRDDPEFARFLPHIPQPFTRWHYPYLVNWYFYPDECCDIVAGERWPLREA